MRARGIECELRENSAARMWNGRPLPAPYVLHLPKSNFDVAFTRHEEGYLVPTLDTWDGEVRAQIGWKDFKATPIAQLVQQLMEGGMSEDAAKHQARLDQAAELELSHIGQLTQAYSNHALVNSVVSEGFTIIDQTTDNEGNIQLRYQ